MFDYAFTHHIETTHVIKNHLNVGRFGHSVRHAAGCERASDQHMDLHVFN